MTRTVVHPGETVPGGIERTPAIGRVLTALSLCMLLPSLGTSIANVGLPAMALAFDATFSDVQWIVLAYLLAVTTLIVGAGRLGDLTGRRRLLLAGILVFTAASLLCGVAPTLELLIIARALQGLGAASMLALTMAMVGETVPSMRTGSAMGLLGTMSAIGTALGPSLGGVLLAGFDWRAIFLVHVPLGLVTMGLAYRALPRERREARTGPAGFDHAGMLTLALTLGAYALAMTVEDGSLGPLTVALLLAAAVGLALFVVIEARAAAPLIPLRMFRDPMRAAGFTTSALVSTVIMTTLVVGPFHLARALGLAPMHVGLVMSAGPVVAALVGIPAGRSVDRLGADRMVVVGLVAVLAGSIAMALMPVRFGVPGYLAPLVVITAGYALFQAANITTVMTGVGSDQRGLVSGLLNLSRNLGLVTGASAMGAVFAFASGTSDITTAAPGSVAIGTRGAFAAAAVLMAVGLAVAIASRSRARRSELPRPPY